MATKIPIPMPQLNAQRWEGSNVNRKWRSLSYTCTAHPSFVGWGFVFVLSTVMSFYFQDMRLSRYAALQRDNSMLTITLITANESPPMNHQQFTSKSKEQWWLSRQRLLLANNSVSKSRQELFTWCSKVVWATIVIFNRKNKFEIWKTPAGWKPGWIFYEERVSSSHLHLVLFQ